MNDSDGNQKIGRKTRPMTPKQLEHFRQLLDTQQQELLATNDSAKASTQPVTLDQASVGRLSRMDAL